MLLKNIQSKIYEIRNQKVMLDFDLAAMYEIETKVLNQAVKRNIYRFPIDFMLRLSKNEWKTMRSQFVPGSQNKRNTNITPFAFTEQCVAVLSVVLKIKKAVQGNVSITRLFVALKQMIVGTTELFKKLEKLESKYNKQFSDVY